MLQQLKNLFGGKSQDFAALIREGAQVIDVRSKDEFEGGHLKGSINIPLQDLPKRIIQIRKDKPVIVCCASGMRSSTASQLLKSKGYTVYNGGGWRSLERSIK